MIDVGRISEDRRWIEENRDWLANEFPGHMIAVRERELLGASLDPETLIIELRQQGFSISDYITEFI